MNTMQAALRVSQIKDEEQRISFIQQNWTRAGVFELHCHLAILMTLHTGKRPGVLCGIKLADVYNADKFWPKDTGEEVYRIKVVPKFEFAMYKTVPVAYIHMSEDILILLETLTFLWQVVDRHSEDARLFTSASNFALLDVWDLIKRAWSDSGCKGRFNSTMIQHTIVTASTDPEHNLSVDEVKALA